MKSKPDFEASSVTFAASMRRRIQIVRNLLLPVIDFFHPLSGD